ncbi:MAG: RNA 2',3'-cyclic phosphodiesterase [Methanobacteriaceae archaeon]|nr:RNA 2',3'-cyclic phosphodiesterase [Methanobacteriaceae archaeon]MDP2835589.1 RNA 2',3'-cyclic phosphodiesterase [Methanobacteriaceae archaeon]
MVISQDLRAFLAVDIDESLIDRIVEIQEIFKYINAPVKFVEPDNLHFTLKFFGDVNEAKIDEINDIIVKSVENFSPFDILINGIGVFPSLRYIRVLWLGAENFDSFSNLQMELDHEFVKIGFEKERNYVPHLTIGRLKGSGNKDALVKKIEELNDIAVGKTTIDKLILKKSELTPDGPIYTDLKVFNL